MIGVIFETDSCEAVTHFFLSTSFQNVIITDEGGRMVGDVCSVSWRQFLWEHDDKNFTVSEALSIIRGQTVPSRLMFADVRQNSGSKLISRLDDEGHVLGVNFARPVRPATPQAQGLLMAGGFGRRLGDLTRDKPKPMLPVGKKPIAEHLIDNFVNSGVDDIFMSVHFCRDALIDHFGDGVQHNARFHYVHEDKPLGTAGCLSLISDKVTAPLLVVNGDIYTDLQFHRLIDYHHASEADITITVKRHSVTVPYGVIETNPYGNFIMREKPHFSYAINAAIYVLSPKVLKHLEHGVKIDMPTLIQHLASLGAKVSLFPLMETWIDIGTLPELSRARLLEETKGHTRPKLFAETPRDDVEHLMLRYRAE